MRRGYSSLTNRYQTISWLQKCHYLIRIPSVPHVTRTCIGEDGTIRGWTADRGKLCGLRKFTAHSEPAEDVDNVEQDNGEGNKAGVERDSEEVPSAAKEKGEIPIPVCALASCRLQPLIAVGLCHGAVHIMFVKQVSNFCVWRGTQGNNVLVYSALESPFASTFVLFTSDRSIL